MTTSKFTKHRQIEYPKLNSIEKPMTPVEIR